MKIECKSPAYNLITGEKLFTRGAIYSAIVEGNDIRALNDKGEWSIVSTKLPDTGLFENDVFNFHFKIVKKLKIVS